MGHRHRHRGQNRNQIPQRTIKPTVFGTIVILLTAAYLLVLYLIHMNYLDELIGSFIYIMLTVTALAYLPGVLTKILCSIGLSISLIYLIYVINPTLFLGICVCSAIAVVLFICFVASSVKTVGRFGLPGLALGFGIGTGGVVGVHVARRAIRPRNRKRLHQ